MKTCLSLSLSLYSTLWRIIKKVIKNHPPTHSNLPNQKPKTKNTPNASIPSIYHSRLFDCISHTNRIMKSAIGQSTHKYKIGLAINPLFISLAVAIPSVKRGNRFPSHHPNNPSSLAASPKKKQTRNPAMQYDLFELIFEKKGKEDTIAFLLFMKKA